MLMHVFFIKTLWHAIIVGLVDTSGPTRQLRPIDVTCFLNELGI